MRTASGLALIAVGAILAFAVTAHPSFFNIQVAGWVIMLTGLAGILIPRRGYGWLRRRLVFRRGPGVPVAGELSGASLPPYVKLNPASVMSVDDTAAGPAAETSTDFIDAEYEGAAEGMQPTEETVEEFRQE